PPSRCSAYPRRPPSFPTRRSSDLRYFDSRISREQLVDVYVGGYIVGGCLVAGAFHDLRAYAAEAEGCVPERTGYRCEVGKPRIRSEEHTSELQSREHLVCRLLLEK